MCDHGPTHVDAIAHLDPSDGAPTIDAMPLDTFYGDGDVRRRLAQGAARVRLRRSEMDGGRGGGGRRAWSRADPADPHRHRRPARRHTGVHEPVPGARRVGGRLAARARRQGVRRRLAEPGQPDLEDLPGAHDVPGAPGSPTSRTSRTSTGSSGGASRSSASRCASAPARVAGPGGRRPAVSRPPRVLVAGGSLGGLTAAHVLSDLGCDVDRPRALARAAHRARGGIVLHPATVRWWREHDVRPLAEMSAAMRRLRYLDAEGAVAHEQACRYRVSSFDALYRDLSARFDPARHRRGCEVAGFDDRRRRRDRRAGGRRSERCDLLVGADGIGSRARRCCCPRSSRATPATSPGAARSSSTTSRPRPHDALLGAIVYHLCPHSHFLAYPIPGADGSVEPGPAADELALVPERRRGRGRSTR